jgi:DtxR family Mn-dependent transcriptional regulator
VAEEKRSTSRATEDYLKAILRLELEGVRATTGAIADALGVSQPSASAMAKKLTADGYLVRTPYRGVVLTELGRRTALETVRHHRLLERFLADTLGLPLDEVHAQAERLEHALSEELEARIDEALGFPTHDPHGDPIPDRELRLVEGSDRRLLHLVPGERSTVARVPDGDPALLRYLSELALVPGAPVELVSVAPFDGPATVRTRAGDHAIGRDLAKTIRVEAAA